MVDDVSPLRGRADADRPDRDQREGLVAPADGRVAALREPRTRGNGGRRAPFAAPGLPSRWGVGRRGGRGGRLGPRSFHRLRLRFITVLASSYGRSWSTSRTGSFFITRLRRAPASRSSI